MVHFAFVRRHYHEKPAWTASRTALARGLRQSGNTVGIVDLPKAIRKAIEKRTLHSRSEKVDAAVDKAIAKIKSRNPAIVVIEPHNYAHDQTKGNRASDLVFRCAKPNEYKAPEDVHYQIWKLWTGEEVVKVELPAVGRFDERRKCHVYDKKETTVRGYASSELMKKIVKGLTTLGKRLETKK